MTPVRLTLWVKFPLSSTALSSCSLHDLIRTIYFPAKRHSTSEYTLQRHYHTRWIFTVIVLRHDKLYLVWPPNNHKICLSTKMSIHINYTHMRAHAHTHTHTLHFTFHVPWFHALALLTIFFNRKWSSNILLGKVCTTVLLKIKESPTFKSFVDVRIFWNRIREVFKTHLNIYEEISAKKKK